MSQVINSSMLSVPISEEERDPVPFHFQHPLGPGMALFGPTHALHACLDARYAL